MQNTKSYYERNISNQSDTESDKNKTEFKKGQEKIKFDTLTTTYTSELVTLIVALHQGHETSTLILIQVKVVQLN